jgi:hypothetical protein
MVECAEEAAEPTSVSTSYEVRQSRGPRARVRVRVGDGDGINGER